MSESELEGFRPIAMIVDPATCEELGGPTREELRAAWGFVPELVRVEDGQLWPVEDE